MAEEKKNEVVNNQEVVSTGADGVVIFGVNVPWIVAIIAVIVILYLIYKYVYLKEVSIPAASLATVTSSVEPAQLS